MRQLSVDDWLLIFQLQPLAVEQVDMILDRVKRGCFLATWERNCLRAYERLARRAA